MIAHVQYVDEVVFFRKYRLLIEIMTVEVLNLIVRALVHFWDLDYKCFFFRNVDLCPTIEEYRMLMEFHNHLYRVYFPLRDDKVIPGLSKLLKIHNLTKFLEKNASELKWKLLEIELERKKSQHRALIKRDKLVSLGIFGFVLFPSLIGVISLEGGTVFIEYENTQINHVVAILDETILTLNHCRKTGK